MARVVVGTFLLLLAAARPSAAQDDFGYEPRYQDPGPPPAALAIGCVCSLLISGAFGFAGYSMGKSKGLGTPGFFLGFFLGIIGLIIVAVLEGNPRPILRRRMTRRPLRGRPQAAPPAAPPGAKGLVPCPYCAEMIQAAANLCRFCNSRLR